MKGNPNDRLFVGWRKLSLSDLKNRILTIQRLAVPQHFDERQWRTLDRMRKRVTCEAAYNEHVDLADAHRGRG